MGSSAFKDCSSLKELTIRSDIANPGTLPFRGNALETLTFSSGVTKIADFLFNGDCSSLVTLNLPSSLRTIGLQAFNGGENITARYAGTEAQWSSVYRSGWEPYAIVYGATQPIEMGARSVTNRINRLIVLPDVFPPVESETGKTDEEQGNGQAVTPSSVPMSNGETGDGGG